MKSWKGFAMAALATVVFGISAQADPMMGGPALPFNMDPATLKANPALESEIIVTSPEMPQPLPLKIHAKPQKIRIEGAHDGKQFVSIINAEQNAMYILNPEDQSWVKWTMKDKMKKDAAAAANPGLTFSPAAGYVKGGRETVDGKECQVWSTANAAGETGKAWVWTKNNILVQAKMTTPKGASSFLLKNLKLRPQADSLFAPPAGARVNDMSAMMKMYEQAREKVNPYPDRATPNPEGFGTPTY